MIRPLRRRFLLLLFVLIAMGLMARVIQLQVSTGEFLLSEASARHVRYVDLPVPRGTILDRHGEPVAISTPIFSVWANPKLLASADEAELSRLTKILDIDAIDLRETKALDSAKEFVYLQRHISPDVASVVRDLNISGVNLIQEYHRYYPSGEVLAHLIGFTDIDDNGLEGAELGFNKWLKGVPGKKRVIKDRKGQIIENVEYTKVPKRGKELYLSIDLRLQYLAYRELKKAVINHNAKSGSFVLIDAQSGEILAMANQPSFNPNDRGQFRAASYRNRAVIDQYEPGSIIKPFIVAGALETRNYVLTEKVSTSPGYVRVGRHMISDVRNFGVLDLSQILIKSSNVGIAKIALSLDPQNIWKMLTNVGFGVPVGLGLPGESNGVLKPYSGWRPIEQASVAYGYGMSATPMQMAKAYSVIANMGVSRPLSITRITETQDGQQVMQQKVAKDILRILEGVVSKRGTAPLARTANYRVAGKTGTVKKSREGEYSDVKYVSIFAGIAPTSKPKLVAAVVINEPSGGQYYGGKVAAPLFSNVISGALRILSIPPDLQQQDPKLIASMTM